ncbi:MAG TPA: redoxin family protein [Candidatus Limnocylindria bacterium]|jgi:thiol-disulfide isomerase/thioredoxin|nr:redoxin family protein [Candidatus Limnocylindria bacterium]
MQSATPFIRRRLNFWLVAGAVLVAVSLWLRPRLRQSTAVNAAMAADSVDDTALREATEGRPLPPELVERFWNTQRFPHRRAALGELVNQATNSPDLLKLWNRLLPEAALDPDYEVRARALGELASPGGAGQLDPVLWQLADADPELRRLGLQHLRRLGGLAQVPLVLPLVDDPDTSVALYADSVLRQWSGRDSGLRLSRVLPPRANLLASPVPEEDLAAIKQASEQWRQWWRIREKPPEAETASALPVPPTARTLPCPQIQLPDLHGNVVDVASFHGKRVLLNFWTTWCPGCLVELPLLVELQRRHPDDLVILGISLDSAEQGALADAAPNTAGAIPPDAAQVRKIVGAVAGRQRLNYRVLLDPENRIGRQFNGGELPTNVLLDRDGRVRRRFVGERSVEVWEALLSDIERPASH